MKPLELERLIGLLAEASPKSVFLEVAFLESYVAARRKRGGRVPLMMLERALPFLDRELNWKPRPIFDGASRPAWAQFATNAALAGLILARTVSSGA